MRTEVGYLTTVRSDINKNHPACNVGREIFSELTDRFGFIGSLKKSEPPVTEKLTYSLLGCFLKMNVNYSAILVIG